MQAKIKKTIIVGGGLAGLTCAKVLARNGVEFVLCEAGSVPGGRVVSRKSTDGYVLDRGFQVLLDSYPTAQRHLDYKSLGGGRFRSGALFVGCGNPVPMENPLLHPMALFRTARHVIRPRVMDVSDMLRLGALVLEGFVRHNDDTSVADLLVRRGFSPKFLANFARPFFGGVLLDPDLQTSATLLLGYLKHFATGRALLPGDGVGSIGRQLADLLPAGAIRYNAPVVEVLCHNGCAAGVRLPDGEMLDGTSVVVATDEPAACRLLGRGSARPGRPTGVHYFAAPRAWYRGAWLCLPPRQPEMAVMHAALLTNVAPTLAPTGSHLWSVTVASEHAHAADAGWVAREVASWFNASRDELRHIDYVTVPYAVPAQLPGFSRRLSPWGKLPTGVHVAGDAVSGASIDAVMASGEAAAKKVISSARSN
jgi:phytoene dehydrogenase-like protein